jgi:hypothetical protein
MSKFICATYFPQQNVYQIPKEWELKDIHIKYGTLYYKSKAQDLECLETTDDFKEPQEITNVYKNNFLYEQAEEFFDCEPEEEEPEEEEREAEEREAMQKEDKKPDKVKRWFK